MLNGAATLELQSLSLCMKSQRAGREIAAGQDTAGLRRMHGLQWSESHRDHLSTIELSALEAPVVSQVAVEAQHPLTIVLLQHELRSLERESQANAQSLDQRLFERPQRVERAVLRVLVTISSVDKRPFA